MFAVDPDPAPITEDALWHALADPTRRALLDRLAAGPRTTGALCEGFAMSRFGVMKHLGILERCGLVASRREGRRRLNHLNVAPLARLQARWLSPRASALGRGVAELSRRAEEPVMAEPSLRNVDIALDWEIAAPLERVWRALFDMPESWWPADFRAGPAGSVLRFEERLGGRLFEEGPGGGLVWYQVIAIEPMRSVDLTGQLASRYGGPATSMLHLVLAPGATAGTTRFELTDSVFGKLGQGFQAGAADGWRQIFAGLGRAAGG